MFNIHFLPIILLCFFTKTAFGGTCFGISASFFLPFSRVLNRKNTIKTSQLLRTGNGMSDFNSIKVRLKHTSLCDKSKAFLSFQFHKGTIKTQTGCKESKSCLIDFNSIKVRLKLSLAAAEWEWFLISIP